MEDRLRRSLEARADDVTPDPALFSVIQSRIRRGRTFRFALAGVAATLAIGGAALAAPSLINRRIEFEPRDLATQPQGEATVTPTAVPVTEAPPPVVAGPSATMVFTDGEGVYAMATDGESAQELVPAPCKDRAATCDYEPVRSVAALPGSPPDDVTAVAARNCGGLQFSATDELFLKDTCPMSVTFSPDGRHLAWVGQAGPGGEWTLHTAGWTAEGPGDATSFGLDIDPGSFVRIEDWIFTEVDSGEAFGSLYLRVVGPEFDTAGLYLLRLDRQGDGALAVPSPKPQSLGRANGWQMLAHASGGGDYAAEDDVNYRLELNTRDNGGPDARIIKTVGAEGGGIVPTPPEFRSRSTGDAGDLAFVWMAAAGNTLVFGDGVLTWVIDWGVPNPQAVPFEAVQRVTHADLVMPAPTTDHPTKTLPVEVYFGMEGADACIANQQVSRQIQGPGVARGAIMELLEGPNSRESNEGVVSPFNANTAGALNDITIVDGEARVDLRDFSDVVEDDSCTKSAILDSLEKTLLQFETITSTSYSFDGDAEAWDTWLGSSTESVPLAVVETAEAIRAAAEVKDWPALRELSRETSCTMSDQPEPCVPYWKDQEANGEDPLGLMVQLLNEAPTNNPAAYPSSMWVWPPEWANPDASGYDGPRIGIDEDGVWRYFVQQGG